MCRADRVIRAAVIGLISAWIVWAQSAVTSSISGAVTAPGGTPAPNVAVGFSEQPSASRNGLVLMHGFVRTQSDGTFRIPGLVAGTFQLCVQAPEALLLDPCIWSFSTRPLVAVTAGKITTGVQLAPQSGTVLKVRLNDPMGLLTGYENTVPGTHLLIAATTPAGFMQVARVVDADNSGKDLELLVPTNTTVNLRVLSEAFVCTDQNGNQSTSGSPTPVAIAQGQAHPAMTFTVTARN